MKQIEHLLHFTREVEILKTIIKEGFKPSYAQERMGETKILIPMISFSNILLSDIGENEVINYGEFAIGFNREWGILNGINPVLYTYNEGLLYDSIQEFIGNSVLLSSIGGFKEYLREFSKMGAKFSENIKVTSTSKETMDIMDYFSINYKPEFDVIIDLISNLANKIHENNLPVINLTKSYKVNNSKGEFIAYNDREWRKLISSLEFVAEKTSEYEKWINAPKPHFSDNKHRLKFEIDDLKIIMIKNEEDIANLCEFLYDFFGKDKIDTQIGKGLLHIETRDKLVESGF